MNFKDMLSFYFAVAIFLINVHDSLAYRGALGFPSSIIKARTHRQDIYVLSSQSSAELIEKNPTRYVQCAACKSSYIIDMKNLDTDFKARCSVCNKVWFQRRDLVLTLNETTQELIPISNEAVATAKNLIAMKRSPRSALVNRTTIYVGNLPLLYNEKDILDIFAEYGVVSINTGKSFSGCGFAFLEIAKEEDANRLLLEMNNFLVDDGKRIACKIARKKEQIGSDKQPHEDKTAYPSASEFFPAGSTESTTESDSLIPDDPFNPIRAQRQLTLTGEGEVLQSTIHVSTDSVHSVTANTKTEFDIAVNPVIDGSQTSIDTEPVLGSVQTQSIRVTSDAEINDGLSATPSKPKPKGRPAKTAVAVDSSRLVLENAILLPDIENEIVDSVKMDVVVGSEDVKPKEKKKGRPKTIQSQEEILN